MYTCDISWAITPASSASLEAAVMVPRLMKHGTAGQREGVDLFLWDDVKLKRPGVLGRDGRDKLLSELTDVLGLRAAVGEHRHLLIHLRGRLQAELPLLIAGHPGIARVGELGRSRLRER
jgi:hypothetical protein